MTGYFSADALALASRGIAALLAALDVVGEPCEFPPADWPGVTASVIA